MRYAVVAFAAIVATGCSADSKVPVAVNEPITATGFGISVEYKAKRLGTLGGARSEAVDINNEGTVVGSSQKSSGATHAFMWTRQSGMVDLGTLPGDPFSAAVAIADNGTILGYSGAGASEPRRIVTWSRSGAIHEVPMSLLPGADRGFFPVDINNRGAVVGYDYTDIQAHPWIWTATSGKAELTSPDLAPTGLDGATPTAINHAGAVVLKRSDSPPGSGLNIVWHGYYRNSQGVYSWMGAPLPATTNPSQQIFPKAINALSVVAGSYSPNTTAQFVPFRWTRFTGFIPLTLDGFEFGDARGINDLGVVVGVGTAPGVGLPVLWDPFGRLIRLPTDGATAGAAEAVNNAGTVAGFQRVGSSNVATIWSLDVSITR